MDTFRVLVYEDEDDHYTKLICALDNAIKSTKCGIKLQVYRATVGPNEYGDGKFESSPKPPYFIKISEQNITYRNIQTNLPIEKLRGMDELWPNFFHGAILDIYDKGGSEVGLKYLNWLSWSGFCGPVALASLKRIPTELYANLPELFYISKGNENTWPDSVAEGVVIGLRAWNGSFPLCSSAGRNKRRSLIEFLDNCRKFHHEGSHPVGAAWYGEEINRPAVLDFFDHGYVDSTNDSALNVYLGSAIIKGAKVAWIDSGEILTPEDQASLLNAIAGLLSGGSRLQITIVVLVDFYQSDASNHDPTNRIDELKKHGVVLLPRKIILDSPDDWAKQAVAKLIQAIASWKENDKLMKKILKGGEYKSDSFLTMRRTSLCHAFRDAYLPVLLMARSKHKIAPSRDLPKPSILTWFDPSPSTRGLVNSNLHSVITGILREIDSSTWAN